MKLNRSVLLARAALLGLLGASGAFDHIDPEASRLESRRAELRGLLKGDPAHLERVLAWSGDLPDVAEEAIRRIRMGWYLSEFGTWEPPPPAPPAPPPRVAVHDGHQRPAIRFAELTPDPWPNRSREEERRRKRARRGGVS